MMSGREHLLQDFLKETRRYIPQMKKDLAALKNGLASPESIEQVHRLFHNIKGAASQVSLTDLSASAQVAEDLLEASVFDSGILEQDAIAFLDLTVDRILTYCQTELPGTEQSSPILEDTLASLKQLDLISIDLHLLIAQYEKSGLLPKSKSEEYEVNSEEAKVPDFIDDSEILPSVDSPTSVSEDVDIEIEIPDFIHDDLQRDEIDISTASEELLSSMEEIPSEVSAIVENENQTSQEDDELLQIFQMECEEHLIIMNNSLIALENIVEGITPLEGEVADHLGEIRRAMHTLKGAASMTGFTELAELAHASEDLLDNLFDISRQVEPDDISLLSRALDVIEVRSGGADKSSENLVSEIQELLRDSLKSKESGTETQTAPPEKVVEINEAAPELEDKQTQETADEKTAHPAEKSESGTTEQSTAKADTKSSKSTNVRVRLESLDELVSLEGELLVSRNSLEKGFNKIADSVGELNLAKERLQRISSELEQGFEVESLFGFGKNNLGQQQRLTGQETDYSDFDPIELDRYSQMSLIIRSLNELSVDIGAIHAEMTGTAGEIRSHIGQQQLMMRLMQDKLKQVQMTPMSSISRTFFRTVRNAARQLEKNVKLQVEGEEVYLDRYIWSKIVDPIMHILRNSVDHGIEGRAERKQAGKPTEATIKLKASQRGSHVLMSIEDDGRGLNYDAVCEKLKQKKLVDDPSQLSEQELQEYIFTPGFSTSAELSQISGRGVGLDVVRKNIQELRGTVRVDSTGGQGTVFHLRIPVTLTINRVVVVSVGTEKFAVPLTDISEIRRLGAEEWSKDDNGLSVLLDGQSIRLIELRTRLGAATSPTVAAEGDSTTVLLAENSMGIIAFQIDQVHEQQEIVVKNLGPHLVHVPGISGVTTNADGSLLPILNLSELAMSSDEKTAPELSEQGAQYDQAARVMIVDDSVSVRTSVSRLIKDMGWEPLLASDGVDATEKIGDYQPDLIILDIEMPRMNGFEFMSVLQNSEEFKHIPVVMLTSRVSEKHEKKAKELGVNRYVYKPYERQDFIDLLHDTVDVAGSAIAA